MKELIIIIIMEHESDRDTNCNSLASYRHHRIVTGTGGFGNKMTSGDHPNDSIIKIGQNTEKSPGVKNSYRSKL